jgi:TatA/E family protein of Tat protein translocase
MMEIMNLGLSEMIFIFLLALLIFGPKKMPEIGRQIGRALAEFRRASNEFKAQIESEIQNLEHENPSGEILPPLKSVEGAVPQSPAPLPVSSTAQEAAPEHAVAKAPDA